MKDEMKKCGCVKKYDDMKRDCWWKDDDDMERDCWWKDHDDKKKDCCCKDHDDKKKDCCCKDHDDRKDCCCKDHDDKKKDCWWKDDDDKKKDCWWKDDDDKKKDCWWKDHDDRKDCWWKDHDDRKDCCCKDHDDRKDCCCKDHDDGKDCCCKDHDDRKKDCCCSSSSMCNFAPVCCNGICPVPGKPHRVDIVLGAGMFENEAEPEEPEVPEVPEPEKANVQFKIRIFKECDQCKGELLIADHENGILIHSEKLECFHSDFRTKMVAIFHIPEGPTTGAYELTVYASPAYCAIPAKFHAFSAPLCDEGIFIGGNVSVGDIMICKDKKQH